MIRLAERTCFVAVWAFVLPLAGYSFFTIFTLGIAGLGLLLGLKTLTLMIYMTGFVPTAVTAAVYEFILRRFPLPAQIAGSCAIGMVSATVWWQEMKIGNFGPNHATLALLGATFCSAGLMPLLGRTWDERKALQATAAAN